MSPSAAERRSDPRIPVKLEVNYLNIDGFISDYTVNISRGGMFISTSQPLKIGTEVSLELKLSDQVIPVEITGTVTWVTEPDRGSDMILPGMGVEFDNLDEQSKKLLEKFIEQNS